MRRITPSFVLAITLLLAGLLDNHGKPVQGARVTGTWHPGGSASCVTTSSGTCSVQQTRNGAMMTWTVKSLSHASLSHDPSRAAAATIEFERP